MYYIAAFSSIFCLYLLYRLNSKEYVGGKISYKTEESRKDFLADYSTDYYFFHCIVHDEKGKWTKDVKISVPEEVYNQFEIGEIVTIKL